MKEDNSGKQKIKFKPNFSGHTEKTWILKIILLTFSLSAVFSVVSSGVMNMVSFLIALLILFIIIFIGILFDIIGVAVTTAQEAPFHSMATKRVRYANMAIRLIRMKDVVANLCNDVVGDICGIISGSASAVIVTYILRSLPSLSGFFVSVLVTALVASLTVGGKALGKGFAIKYSNAITYSVAKILTVVSFRRK